jgi:regulator of protease activity HflC (stomatin/prohibitin superfamily)
MRVSRCDRRFIIASALKMANTWQKFVILRAGKLRGVKGPGLFVIIPVIDHVVAVIDERIQTTAFSAEEALTKDTVPVNVDAIIFWFVHDAQKAALNITNHREAIDRGAQTSLREVALQDAMSRQAQAEREKQARVFLDRPKRRSPESSLRRP